jgi:hypothetical protein
MPKSTPKPTKSTAKATEMRYDNERLRARGRGLRQRIDRGTLLCARSPGGHNCRKRIDIDAPGEIVAVSEQDGSPQRGVVVVLIIRRGEPGVCFGIDSVEAPSMFQARMTDADHLHLEISGLLESLSMVEAFRERPAPKDGLEVGLGRACLCIAEPQPGGAGAANPAARIEPPLLERHAAGAGGNRRAAGSSRRG